VFAKIWITCLCFTKFALGLLIACGVFQIAHGNNRQYTDNDLDTWRADDKLKRNYPYYLAGTDFDGEPVFIWELGKWPVRKTIELGSVDAKHDLDKYVEQMFYTWFKTVDEFETKNGAGTGNALIIIDFEGYQANELAHLPTLSFVLRNITQRFQQSEFTKILDYVLVINANYVAETVINLAKPLVGVLATNLEVYGTNKQKWIPKLLRKVPRESLPEWYGGVKDFKPVKVYG